MEIETFIESVRQLRAAQKAYFKDRLQSDLIRSKQLEREVDQALEHGITWPTAMLEQMDGEPAEGKQIGMFQDDDNISLLETDDEWLERWTGDQA